MITHHRAIALAAALLCLAAAPCAAETAAQKDRRMSWFREARFGMFIHWGIYAIPAGEWNGKQFGGGAEWIMNSGQATVAEYEPLVKRFNPVQFDARQWVRMARNAGVKYIVITSKHHDGFCLFDAHNSNYTVAATPFRRDILKELSIACRAEGVRLCFYHSIMDWHHPDYGLRRPWDLRPDIPTNMPRYIEYLKAQLKQLVQEYHPGIMWFDGEWESVWTHAMGQDLYEYVRSLDPAIIVNNRVDKGRQDMAGMTKAGEFAGDYGTPEQEIPATGLPGVDWESCMTMNGTWGFSRADTNWKSSETLIRMLVDTASKGGNLLLNVGPTAEGLIPEASVERLAAMGAWLKVNGEAVYGTTASPLGAQPWGRCTARPGKLYLHVFNWPASGTLTVSGMPGTARRARLLGDRHARVTLEQTGGTLTVTLPAKAPDPVDTVLAIEMR